MKNVLAVLAVLLVSASFASAAYVFDSFNFGGASHTVGGVGTSGPTVEGPGVPEVVGGYRSSHLEVTASSVAGTSELKVNDAGNGVLIFNNDAGNSGIATLLYDASGAGLGLDLSADIAFEFDLIFSDLDLVLSVELEDGDGTVEEETLLVPGPGAINLPFAAWSAAMDFSDIDSIKLTLEGPAAQDLILDQFSSSDQLVPEPATMGLLGLAATGLVGYIRKRRVA